MSKNQQQVEEQQGTNTQADSISIVMVKLIDIAVKELVKAKGKDYVIAYLASLESEIDLTVTIH